MKGAAPFKSLKICFLNLTSSFLWWKSTGRLPVNFVHFCKMGNTQRKPAILESARRSKSPKTFWAIKPQNVMERAMYSAIGGVTDTVCEAEILNAEVEIAKFGIKLKLFDLAGIITNFVVVFKNCPTLDTFFCAIITAISQIFNKTYSDMFKMCIRGVIKYFSLLFFRVYRGSLRGKKRSVKSKSISEPDLFERPVPESFSFDLSMKKQVDSFLADTLALCESFDCVNRSEFSVKFTTFMSLIATVPFVGSNKLLSRFCGYSELAERALIKSGRDAHKIPWIMNLVKCVTYTITKVLDVAYHKGDLSRLTSDNDEIADYEQRYNKALYLCDHLDTIETHGMNIREFLQEVVVLGDTNIRLRQYARQQSVKGVLKHESFNLMRCQYRALEKLNVMAQRDPPIAIVFNGPPGCGKTNVVDIALKVMYDCAIANGYANEGYDPKMKYTFNWSSEFLSGWRVSSEVMLIDDVGQWSKDITVANKGGALVHFIDWVNGTPHLTNQAELENKGCIPMMAKYVIMTTNFEDAGFSNVFQATGGAWRRPYFIQMAVKPEYAKPGSDQLLGNLEDSGYTDLHLYLPYKFDIVNGKRNKYYWDHSNRKWVHDAAMEDNPEPYMTYVEMNEFYRDIVVIPHYETIKRSKAALAKVFQGGPCKQCKGSTVMCNCAAVESSVIADNGIGDETEDEDMDGDSDASPYEDMEDGETGVWSRASVLSESDQDLMCSKIEGYPLHQRVAAVLLASCCYPVYGFWGCFPNSKWAKERREWHLMVMAASVCTTYHPSDNYGTGPISRYRRRWMGWLKGTCEKNGSDFFLFFEDLRTKELLQEAGLYSLVYALGALSLALAIGFTFFGSRKKDAKEELKRATLVRTEATFDTQKLKEISNRDNYWNVVYEDTTRFTGAMSTVTLKDLKIAVSRNILRIETLLDGKDQHTHVLGLFGDVAVCNKHFYVNIAAHLPLKFSIVNSQKVNVGPNCSEVIIDRSNFHDVDAQHDLVFIKHPRFGTFRDIRKFLLNDRMNGKSEGVILVRDSIGELQEITVDGLEKFQVAYSDSKLEYEYPGYTGLVVRHTSSGDCGAPYLAKGLNGYCILGIHSAGVVRRYPHKDVFVCPIYASMKLDSKQLVPLSYNGVDLATTVQSTNPIVVEANLHDKDPIRMLDSASMTVFGTLNVPRTRFYSGVCNTLMHDRVLEHYHLDSCNWSSPRTVSTRSCIKLNLETMSSKPSIPCGLVDAVSESLFQMYCDELDALDLWKYIPDSRYDLDVAINGIDGIPHLERLVTKTSGGFGHGGPKLRHLIEVDPTDEHALNYVFDDVINKEYDLGVKMILSGERPDVVWDFNLKDEPISNKKLAENNVRIFNSAPVWFSALERQCFLWCIPLFYGRHRIAFGMGMGANAIGKDWDSFYKYLTKFGHDRIIAGDYKKFDKGMPPELILAAFKVLIRIARKAGFNDEDILLMRGVMTEVAFPMTNCVGTLCGFSGSNPSGHPLTTVINSMVNIMYIMVASATIEVELGIQKVNYRKFLKEVTLLTFGDDNIMGSSHDFINHSSIARALSFYGITYTMADKEQASVPFINIADATFLKRYFKRGLIKPNLIAAPLENDSIIKSLLICKKSDTILFKEQNALIIYSACREYFQYGRDRFELEYTFLNSLVHDLDLIAYLPGKELPNWEFLFLERFQEVGN